MTLGPDAFLAGMPQLVTAQVRGSELCLESVTVRAGAYVGFGATLGPGADVGARAAVADMAYVPAGGVVDTETSLLGLPAVSQKRLAFRRGDRGASAEKPTDFGRKIPAAAYHRAGQG